MLAALSVVTILNTGPPAVEAARRGGPFQTRHRIKSRMLLRKQYMQRCCDETLSNNSSDFSADVSFVAQFCKVA